MQKTGRTVRLMIALAAVMMMVMALGVGSAAAQSYPPGPGASVDCVAAGQAGASVTCTVTGFQPGESLTVTATAADGTVVYSATLTADAQGEATFRFTVPARQRGQQITVTVVGAVTGAVSDTVMVAAPGRTGAQMPLPRTGAGQDALLLAAAGVFLVGA
jgi:hypothetical protein